MVGVGQPDLDQEAEKSKEGISDLVHWAMVDTESLYSSVVDFGLGTTD